MNSPTYSMVSIIRPSRLRFLGFEIEILTDRLIETFSKETRLP